MALRATTRISICRAVNGTAEPGAGGTGTRDFAIAAASVATPCPIVALVQTTDSFADVSTSLGEVVVAHRSILFRTRIRRWLSGGIDEFSEISDSGCVMSCTKTTKSAVE